MRFSILTLLGLVAFVALAFGAMVNADTVIAQVFAPLFCVIFLLVSVSGAIYFESTRRSFCVGFALFGIGYLLIVRFLDEAVNLGSISLSLVEAWIHTNAANEEYVFAVGVSLSPLILLYLGNRDCVLLLTR